MRELFFMILSVVFMITQLIIPNSDINPGQTENSQKATEQALQMSGIIIRGVEATQSPTATTAVIEPTSLITEVPATPTALPQPAEGQPVDPIKLFGEPMITDNFQKGSSGFGLNAGLNDDEAVRIIAIDEKLSVEPKNDNGWLTWRLRPPVLTDGAAEMEFAITSCARGDRMGLVMHAGDYNSGYGYYFAVACEGTVSILRNTTILASNTVPGLFKKGSGDINVLTAVVQGSKLTALLNGQEAVSIEDSNFTEGFSGFFTAPQGKNTLKLDILSYKEFFKTE